MGSGWKFCADCQRIRSDKTSPLMFCPVHDPSTPSEGTFDHLFSESMQDVLMEIRRQRQKWGEQDHPTNRYFLILVEEFMEMAQNVVSYVFAPDYMDIYGKDRGMYLKRIRAELIQVAAVSISWLATLKKQQEDEPMSEQEKLHEWKMTDEQKATVRKLAEYVMDDIGSKIESLGIESDYLQQLLEDELYRAVESRDFEIYHKPSRYEEE